MRDICKAEHDFLFIAANSFEKALFKLKELEIRMVIFTDVLHRN